MVEMKDLGKHRLVGYLFSWPIPIYHPQKKYGDDVGWFITGLADGIIRLSRYWAMKDAKVWLSKITRGCRVGGCGGFCRATPEIIQTWTMLALKPMTGWWWLEHLDIFGLCFFCIQLWFLESQLTHSYFSERWNHQPDDFGLPPF